MRVHSAGLLPYRVVGGGALDLFLVHPGGPLWLNKDEHAWSIAKGEYGENETALDAAEREFAEEVGVRAPAGVRLDLGEIKQASGKLVRAWAIEAAQFEVDEVVSNEFAMEWPPRSGRRRVFPEVDRAEWMSAATARQRLVKAQAVFVDRLVQRLGRTGEPEFP
jgi:predicted NUDIX family NTP pyrophosphohydrolase